MDRMIRGAYMGRLRPGRVSSWLDREGVSKNDARPMKSGRSNAGLGIVPEHRVPEGLEGEVSAGQSAEHDGQFIEDGAEQDNDVSKPPLVRIHSECYTGETAWSARCDCVYIGVSKYVGKEVLRGFGMELK